MRFLDNLSNKKQKEVEQERQKQQLRAEILATGETTGVFKEIMKIIDEHIHRSEKKLVKRYNDKKSWDEHVRRIMMCRAKYDCLTGLKDEIRRTAKKAEEYAKADTPTEK